MNPNNLFQKILWNTKDLSKVSSSAFLFLVRVFRVTLIEDFYWIKNSNTIKKLLAAFRAVDKPRLYRYLRLSFVVTLTLWSISIAYLLFAKKTYTTKWAIILPGASNTVNLNLEGLGQASVPGEAVIASSSSDQRANYEYIFSSKQVLSRAARIANLSPDDFGEPMIKLVENTTLMEIAVRADTPPLAVKKSYALYQSISERLDALRQGEITQRRKPIINALAEAEKRLQDVRRNLTTFQSKTNFLSTKQVDLLNDSIEKLRLQQAETKASLANTSSSLSRLQSTLSLTPKQSADAFLLITNQPFQESLSSYAKASSQFNILKSKFGVRHPKVLIAASDLESSKRDIIYKARMLTGKLMSEQSILNLSLERSDTGRSALLLELIRLQFKKAGLESDLRSISTSLESLDRRLTTFAQPQGQLQNLERQEQIAEAVFASTLTRLDLGTSNQFAAFPLTHIAVDPELPDKPSSPRSILVFLGALVGTIFFDLGLFVLWLRKSWVKRASDFIYK